MTKVMVNVTHVPLTHEDGSLVNLALLVFPETPTDIEFRRGIRMIGLQEAGIEEYLLFKKIVSKQDMHRYFTAFTKVDKEHAGYYLMVNCYSRFNTYDRSYQSHSFGDFGGRVWRFAVLVPDGFEYVRSLEWPNDDSKFKRQGRSPDMLMR